MSGEARSLCLDNGFYKEELVNTKFWKNIVLVGFLEKKIMNCCILPLEKNPVIRTYQHLAYSFSILGTDQNSCNWLCNQYTQLINDGKNSMTFYLDFLHRQDALECERISCETIKKFKIDIVELIRDKIKEGWYVYICIDEFYIPERDAYQKEHFIHDCLVYGFDDFKKEFHIIGYNDKEMYQDSRVSYIQIKDSEPRYWICCIKKSEQYKFLLDINKIYIDFKRYLNLMPEIILGDFDYKSAVFGQETNDLLIKYIEDMSVKRTMIDIRYIYLFYEHKKCMLIRLKQLQKFIGIGDANVVEYQKVVSKAEKLVRITLKYNIKYCMQIHIKMSRYIKEIAEKEKRIILDILKNTV